MASRGTGSVEKCRVVRRVDIAAWNSRARRTTSSTERRVNASGLNR
jgi:hypothetical protein